MSVSGAVIDGVHATGKGTVTYTMRKGEDGSSPRSGAYSRMATSRPASQSAAAYARAGWTASVTWARSEYATRTGGAVSRPR
jgi:hypothetical protein